MEKEKDSLADYFLTDNEERRKYEREKREEIKRIEREREEYDRAKRLEEIRRRGAEKNFTLTQNKYPGYAPTEDELSEDELFALMNQNSEPLTADEYARKHGFRNSYDRDRFNRETRGMYFLQKMNYLIENADEYGINSSTYYLDYVSSENPVQFCEAIIEASILENPKVTYSELKEELETIHDYMIMDVASIKEITSKGKSRQWNKRIHRSADGVEFCVFNQLKTDLQMLRAIAFSICHRKWNLYVEYDDSFELNY